MLFDGLGSLFDRVMRRKRRQSRVHVRRWRLFLCVAPADAIVAVLRAYAVLSSDVDIGGRSVYRRQEYEESGGMYWMQVIVVLFQMR